MSNDNAETEKQVQEQFKEATKLGFEAPKHFTTLSAGSVVLIGTFLKDIFPRDAAGFLMIGIGVKLLVAAAFLALAISLVAAALIMNIYVRLLIAQFAALPNMDQTSFNQRRGDASIALSRSVFIWIFIPFFLGLACFGVAVLINLFSTPSTH